ncbi:MAG: tetratricopeptide repeat protein [Spirochaetales bacterium]|nr:tetratricopeptide repeat protein [Spirochaetales bacterium]
MGVRKWSLLVIFSYFLFSCSYVNPGLQVFWGNYLMDQGNFKRANLYYLEALEWGENDSLVNYNIGNVYYSLGERDSALARWNQSDSEELNFRFMLTFNKGVYYFEKGLYEEAAQSFRQAVVLKPTDWDSKINLELAMDRVNNGLDLKNDETDQEKKDDLQDDTERLLNYLKRQENYTWEPAEKLKKNRENDW